MASDNERIWCAQLDDMPLAFVRVYLRHRDVRGPDADTIAFAWVDRGRSVSVDVFADGRVEVFTLDGDTTTDGRDTLSCVSTTSIRALVAPALPSRFCQCALCRTRHALPPADSPPADEETA